MVGLSVSISHLAPFPLSVSCPSAACLSQSISLSFHPCYCLSLSHLHPVWLSLPVSHLSVSPSTSLSLPYSLSISVCYSLLCLSLSVPLSCSLSCFSVSLSPTVKSVSPPKGSRQHLSWALCINVVLPLPAPVSLPAYLPCLSPVQRRTGAGLQTPRVCRASKQAGHLAQEFESLELGEQLSDHGRQRSVLLMLPARIVPSPFCYLRNFIPSEPRLAERGCQASPGVTGAAPAPVQLKAS